MIVERLSRRAAAVLLTIVVAACSGHGGTPALSRASLPTPKSVSPASIAPAPMAKTAILPASAMARKPNSAIEGANWTQLPGSATQVTAAGDGSIWVLSTQPSGADKYIWHYTNGSWTNISGLASHLAAAPNGTLYAINSGGGTYAYNGSSWTALGGGASAITAASDGSTYVLSNAGAGPDRAIWHNVNGAWSQVPGSGTALASSWDTGTYVVQNGTIAPNGFYVLNSAGSIYYENTNGSFATLPGKALAIAPPTSGGAFVLGYPADASGDTVYYYDLNGKAWTSQHGTGVSIAADSGHVYVVSASGGIYSSPVWNAAGPSGLNAIAVTSIGPTNLWGGVASGKLNTTAIVQSSPSTMYVAGGYASGLVSTQAGIYKSTDGGATWSPKDNGLTNTSVNDVWIDQSDPNVVVAATEIGGIFRSTDAGESWVNVNPVKQAMQLLSAGSTLYAATQSGVLASSDSGATWSLAQAMPANVTSLSGNASTLYAGLSNGQVFAYNGVGWSASGTISGGAPIVLLAEDTATPSTLYASANAVINGIYTQGLYRSTDSGATWTNVGLPSGERGAQVIAMSPTVPHKLYVGGTGQYYTMDGGQTFTASAGLGDERGLLVLPNGSGGDKCFVTSDQGLFGYSDCNTETTRTNYTHDLSINVTTDVAVHGNTILAMLQDFSPYVSFDGGHSWSNTNAAGANFSEDGDAAFNPGNPQYCYGYDGNGFETSSDGCRTFKTTGTFTLSYQATDMIAFDPQLPSTMYVVSSGGVMRSTDSGLTFSATGWPVGDPDAVDVDPTNHKHILVSSFNPANYSSTLYVTSDGGSTWSTSNLICSFEAPALDIDPANPLIVLAASPSYDGVYISRSTDGGLTFEQESRPIVSSQHVQGLPLPFNLLIPNEPDLRVPRNGAMSPSKFLFPVVKRLRFNPNSSNPAAVVTTEEGVFASSDSGITWSDLDVGGSISRFITTFQWVNGRLYIATDGQGVLETGGPLQ